VENPFDRYGLDPRDSIELITQRLKELAEDATDEAERDELRAAWEKLTLHPAERLRAVLFAYPETRAPLGRPPAEGRHRAPTEESGAELSLLRALAARPSALRTVFSGAAKDLDEGPGSLDDDPLLRT
jgi:hypothetical protein